MCPFRSKLTPQEQIELIKLSYTKNVLGRFPTLLEVARTFNARHANRAAISYKVVANLKRSAQRFGICMCRKMEKAKLRKDKAALRERVLEHYTNNNDKTSTRQAAKELNTSHTSVWR